MHSSCTRASCSNPIDVGHSLLQPVGADGSISFKAYEQQPLGSNRARDIHGGEPIKLSDLPFDGLIDSQSVRTGQQTMNSDHMYSLT